jgi:hypothetical protein
MNHISKLLIFLGIIFIISGFLWHFTDGKIPLGRLPGDIRIESGNSKIYIPLTSCILVSLILSLIAYLFKK